MGRYTILLIAGLTVGGCAPPSAESPTPTPAALEPRVRACDPADAQALAAAGFVADTTLVAGEREMGGGVRPLSGPWPRYPHELRAREVEGRVQSIFVVDTLGHVVRGSALITYESHPEFGDAVCTWLRRARFAPLIVGGRRRSVRFLQVPTTFELTR